MKRRALLAGIAPGLLGIPLVVAALNLALGTPPSPHHRVVVDRPLVAIVGGRAEHCLADAWPGVEPDRVVNLARRDTDWRAVVGQIEFLRTTAPVGVLVVAIDPEQLLYDRSTHAGHQPDPDRARRAGFGSGGRTARLYGLLDRWASLPRLLDGLFSTGAPRFDPRDWGARQGQHWAHPDGLIAVRRAVAQARHDGVDVVPLLLPLPPEALDAWRGAERGGELEKIRRALAELGAVDHLDSAPALDAYFPDGIGCARQTGRALLRDLEGHPASP